MDVQELDKKQLILLTLLITFVVSIATGIITVSLMNQMPKSVPQTINNVIQRTIEKVTTVQVPTPVTNDKVVNKVADSSKEGALSLFSNSDAIINIYLDNTDISTLLKTSTTTDKTNTTTPDQASTVNDSTPAEVPSLGQGVIISDIGLVLVDSSILTTDTVYKVILNKIDFNASILKKFGNGFTILKISAITDKPAESTDATNKTQ